MLSKFHPLWGAGQGVSDMMNCILDKCRWGWANGGWMKEVNQYVGDQCIPVGSGEK